jgi:hypothetical protein
MRAGTRAWYDTYNDKEADGWEMEKLDCEYS